MRKTTVTTDYEAPRIEDLGDLVEVTAYGNEGKYLDHTFFGTVGSSTNGRLQSQP